MNQPKYDIIPDIHGQHNKLLRLLLLLGYQQEGLTGIQREERLFFWGTSWIGGREFWKSLKPPKQV